MPGSYADLLAESRRRQDAERRADVAEAKLARIRNLHTPSADIYKPDDPRTRCSADLLRWPCRTAQILGADS